MVTTGLKRNEAVARTLLVGMMAITGFACSGSGDDEGVCLENEDSPAVQQDGQCCVFTINCQPGSICNIAGDDLYDADKPEATCIKVTCASNADCDAPKECSLEKTCKVPVCQVDGDCSQGDVCRDGACQAPFPTTDVARCEVVSRATAIRQGAHITLEAVSFNANGKVLAGIAYDWTSSAPDAVAIEGQDAVGGTVEATATITAKPAGRADLTCERNVAITNFPNVATTSIRVVVVADDDGSPVGSANVIVDAGGTMSATTAASGAASVTVAAGTMPTSVTVHKTGWQTLTILSPGSNDLFIPLPRIPDERQAGGFRGSVDLSATEKLDIQLGLVGPAIPSNLLDFGLESLIGDFVPTRIEASQLMLDVEEDLPAGLMLGLGSQQFMADETRCQGDMPGANELGCFLARSAEGPGAGWALAGQLKISAVTSIANELSGVLGGDGGDIEIGPILTAVLPLLRTLNHAVNPSIVTEVHPKVAKPGTNADCTDPAQAADEDLCQGDFTRYKKVPMAATSGLSVLSTINVPNLPDLPGGTGCASGLVLLSGAALEGRGLVPLGVTAGVDVVESGSPDCMVDGIDEPFGDRSDPLDDGQMPLSMAPLHSGIEGSDVFMLAVALDIDSIANSGGLSLSALVHRVDGGVKPIETISGGFLDYPTGTITKSSRTVAVQNTSGAKVTRIELQGGGNTWLVYAPATQTSITLPDIPATRNIVSNANEAYLLTIGTARNYNEMFQFGSGATLDRLFDFVSGFVITACDTDAGSQCRIAD